MVVFHCSPRSLRSVLLRVLRFSCVCGVLRRLVWLEGKKKRAYVELSETEPMLDGIGYGMRKKRDGYVLDLFEERYDVSETGPPIVPTR